MRLSMRHGLPKNASSVILWVKDPDNAILSAKTLPAIGREMQI